MLDNVYLVLIELLFGIPIVLLMLLLIRMIIRELILPILFGINMDEKRKRKKTKVKSEICEYTDIGFEEFRSFIQKWKILYKSNPEECIYFRDNSNELMYWFVGLNGKFDTVIISVKPEINEKCFEYFNATN